MIIVYGTRSTASDKPLDASCNRCGQRALVRSDWCQYFHLMFIPTFPVGKQRTINCHACGNSFDAKGSAPIWTFVGTVILVFCLLGGAAQQALRRFGVGPSAANISAAASVAPVASHAPAAHPAATPAIASVAPAPSTKVATPAASASGKARRKKK